MLLRPSGEHDLKRHALTGQPGATGKRHREPFMLRMSDTPELARRPVVTLEEFRGMAVTQDHIAAVQPQLADCRFGRFLGLRCDVLQFECASRFAVGPEHPDSRVARADDGERSDIIYIE